MSTTQELKPVAEVLLDDALDQALDYRIPEQLIGKIYPGMRVKVPVRNSQRQGIVVATKESSPFSPLFDLAAVLSEKTYVTEELFCLAKWVAEYYCTPLRKVLKAILPVSVRGKAKVKEQLLIKSALSISELASICEELRRKQPIQALALDAVLKHPKGILLSKLLEMNVSRSAIESLKKRKILLCQKVQIDRSPLIDEEYFPTKPKKLNEEQKRTLEKILMNLDLSRFEVQLIHG